MGSWPGIEEIKRKMQVLYEHAAEMNCVNTAEIKEGLEPLFEQYGYRTTHEDDASAQILLIHDDGVGDFINCSPAIHEMRRTYPEAVITLVVPHQSYDMAVTCPYVDHVIVDEKKCDRKDPLALFQWYTHFAAQFLSYHYDLAIPFSPYGSDVLFAYLTGAVHRVGFQSKDGKLSGPFHAEHVRGLLTDQVPPRARGLHAVYAYLPIAEALAGREVQDAAPEIWTLAAETEIWKQKLHMAAPDASWMAVIIGSSSGRRHWPVASYADLLQKVLKEEAGDVRFLLLGGPREKEDGDKLLAALPEHMAWNAVGAMNYRESAAALSCCHLYIGNDTGLMHAAAAVGLPVLSPCCYPADVPMQYDAVPLIHHPYGVPTVFVRPAHALSGCQHPQQDDVRWGCVSEKPHWDCQ